MIDPLLVPLTDWLFAAPDPESREPMDDADPGIFRLVGTGPAPPAAAAPEAESPFRIQRCS